MEERYIGNQLFECMEDILLGDISLDQIDTIYSSYSYTKDSIPIMIKSSNYAWKYVAQLMAEEEIAKSNDFSSRDDLNAFFDREDEEVVEYEEHTEKYKRLHEEVKEKEKELLPKVIEDAKNILHQLFESGKIVSIKYRIPEGDTIKVNTFPGYGFDEDGQIEFEKFYDGELEHKIEVTGGEKIINKNDEVLKLGDKYYAYETKIDNTNKIANLNYKNSSFSSGPLSNNNWFKSERDLIVLQLQGSYSSFDHQMIRDKAFLLGEVFPKYKQVIEYVTENMRKDSGEEDLKELFEEALRETNEHTSDEVLKAVKDVVSQREYKEVLDGITNFEKRTSYEHGKEK